MRLFILMEFCSIPPIVHQLIEFNLVSPNYFFVNVTIYKTIGPFAFSFFVMKKRNRKRLASIWKKLLQKMCALKPVRQTNSELGSRFFVSLSDKPSTATLQITDETHQAPMTTSQMPAHDDQVLGDINVIT